MQIKTIAIVFLYVFWGLFTQVIAGKIDISWNRNSDDDLVGYKIYFGKQSGKYSNCIIVNMDKANYTIENLENGKCYYFAITAYDYAYNESAYSHVQKMALVK